MATLVEDIYNTVAINTGFPIYVNDTDTPYTTAYILQSISEALQLVVDSLYISQNMFTAVNRIITIPNQSTYSVTGIIKDVFLINEESGNRTRIYYNEEFKYGSKNVQVAKPYSYVIEKGMMRLIDTPDKAYNIEVTSSVLDLVLANDDSSRSTITAITDTVVGNEDFISLLVIQASAILLGKAQNPKAEFYANMGKKRIRTVIERDLGTMEAQRTFGKTAGNYNPDKGLLG